ncbi:hemerythrin domain-containing protein [Actinomadura craniellae]|uniref:Hemerythrin domain-containing protein n=1 Tax=Actinomadura craniellae TaxID=2231787 RepID=A0A365H4Y9_9ACTN|nr:hemerythrin domain-containing protein [Actinomadura craniellae]RAY14062.1 hemerythrin domain-containing protein [Actinomadura craniellae]
MASPAARTEGSDLYDELITVHTIMRRGARLTADAFARRAAGEPVDTKTLVGTTHWLVTFVHHHHASEDELFWPVLREYFPQTVAKLDELTAEHHALDVELQDLTKAADALAAGGPSAGDAVRRGAATAARVRDVLLHHLGTEEPALADLMPKVPNARVLQLRKAIVDGAPKAGPDLVLGLLEDPDRPAGYEHMMGNFPPPVRWLRPLLLRRYRSRKKALLGSH